MSMYANYEVMEEFVGVLTAVLASVVPSSIWGIAAYVLSSLALYTLASRRGIGKAWLSWVPVLNVWILGSLSDQYRYVVHGQVKSKRKTLLVLNLLTVIIAVLMLVVAIVLCVDLISGAVYNQPENVLFKMVMGPALAELGLVIPLFGISIAAAVIYFMALYDVYKSMDPSNSMLFLVLSILFNVTEPFFLFFNRTKDEGMPPRKAEPQWTPPEPVYTASPEEPWAEPENKDYL